MMNIQCIYSFNSFPNQLLLLFFVDILIISSPTKTFKRNFRLKGALGGNFRKLPTFLIRFIFPWGLLIQYYEIPTKFVPFLADDDNSHSVAKEQSMDGFTNAEKSLAKWFAGDTEYKNERLKLIAYVPEGPWIVRNMVTGRPAIIGKKLPVSYKYVPKHGIEIRIFNV